uniref:Uncharacterized protein n=1 Tax=Ananas comosus var. bracteatus TaxID=296719 RepID=A0A6V7PSV6_ANACO|nr:unnamed protein product [Ananas comosus var. bracteatus]
MNLPTPIDVRYPRARFKNKRVRKIIGFKSFSDHIIIETQSIGRATQVNKALDDGVVSEGASLGHMVEHVKGVSDGAIADVGAEQLGVRHVVISAGGKSVKDLPINGREVESGIILLYSHLRRLRWVSFSYLLFWDPR